MYNIPTSSRYFDQAHEGSTETINFITFHLVPSKCWFGRWLGTLKMESPMKRKAIFFFPSIDAQNHRFTSRPPSYIKEPYHPLLFSLFQAQDGCDVSATTMESTKKGRKWHFKKWRPKMDGFFSRHLSRHLDWNQSMGLVLSRHQRSVWLNEINCPSNEIFSLGIVNDFLWIFLGSYTVSIMWMSVEHMVQFPNILAHVCFSPPLQSVSVL